MVSGRRGFASFWASGARLMGMVLWGCICMSTISMASDASDRCMVDTGLKVELDVLALKADSIEYRLSMRNVSENSIELTAKLVPWLNSGRVSVVLLDWRAGGSLDQWFDKSKLKFALGGQGQQRGAFFARYVRDLIDSVDGVLKPGQSLGSRAELSISPSDMPLAGSDFARLRREGVFLWTARVKMHSVDCLQSGISMVE